MFQIGAGGQLGDLLGWELTPQKTSKLFAEFETTTLQSDILARAAPQIHQRQSAGPVAETLDAQYQLSARLALDAGNPTDQIAAIVPSLQAQPAVACLEQEVIGRNRERFFTRLAQDRLGAVLKKLLDGVADIGQWDAPVPLLTRGATLNGTGSLTVAVR